MSDLTQLHARIDAFGRAKVLVLGDVMLDRYVHGTVDRISPEAPVPVLKVERTQLMPGGAGNVARNVAALGGRVRLIGLVGADENGRDLQKLLTGTPLIDCELIVDPSRPTITKTRFVAGRRQLLRTDAETADAPAEPVAATILASFARALPGVDVVVLSDYAKGALSDKMIGAIVAQAKNLGKPVIADPKGIDLGRYRGASLLTPNRHEAAAATGKPCAGDEAAALAAQAILRSAGVAAVLVTRGEAGMTLVEGGQAVRHFPAERREVFDVSGAGDTVVATIAVAVATGASLAEAARLANLAAGIVVGKVGTAVVHPADLIGALHAQAVMASEAKIVALETALERIARWRAAGERMGFTNGCFDLIHPGHIALLTQARAAADRLIVGLNSDDSIHRLKGPGRPIQNETARAIVLASLAAVDLVVLFDDDTPMALIRAMQPDVLIKGADYKIDQVVGAEFVRGYGGKIVLADLVAGHSTTGTIARAGLGRAGRS